MAGRDKVAVVPDVVERLPIGAVALDVRHVGAPDQLLRSESLVELADEGPSLSVRVLQTPAILDGKQDLQSQVGSCEYLPDFLWHRYFIASLEVGVGDPVGEQARHVRVAA